MGRAEGASPGNRSSGGGADEGVGVVDGTAAGLGASIRNRLGVGSGGSGDADGELLAQDGLVDDTLTVVVGIAGGVVVGAVGTLVLAVVTGSGWAFAFGLVAWLGSTAYLVRRRTVQGAVSRTGYAVAVVLLTVPVVAASPVVDVEGGLAGRGGLFLVLLLFVSVPAAIAAAVGWLAAKFVPAGAGGSEG